MGRRAQRVFGTTVECLERAERALGRRLPQSFRTWLLAHNGKGLRGVTVFPVADDRDPQTELDGIERQYNDAWRSWLDNFEEDGVTFDHLLPFADFGSGDYYCFDYSDESASGEAPVVRWSHETGETERRADTFADFAARIEAGEFAND